MSRGDRRRCYGCGQRGCPYIDSGEKCPDILCYECNEFGHKGKECREREDDASLTDPDWLRDFADSFGWFPRDAQSSVNGYNARNKTLFLINDQGIKIDVYTSTGTIKTIMDHPSRGPNQMFRPGFHSRAKLQEILEDPRVHTGFGYRTERQGQWKCRECANWKLRGDFSRSQWQRNRAVGRSGPRCLECVGS